MSGIRHGPQPWTQHKASTIFLRVPVADWVHVSRGLKTEFRASAGACSAMWNLEPPAPVVAYRASHTLGYDSKLMVLEEKWQEPLGAISEESLKREGFETLGEFRKYWCARERRKFAPMRLVTCYRVHGFTFQDELDMGKRLLERLYGEFL